MPQPRSSRRAARRDFAWRHVWPDSKGYSNEEGAQDSLIRMRTCATLSLRELTAVVGPVF
jgi:hypothetical protein